MTRNLKFLAFVVLSLIPFGGLLYDLAQLAIRDERYSHIALIPLISASILYLRRREIFANPRYAAGAGIAGLLLAAAGYWLAAVVSPAGAGIESLSLRTPALALTWAAGFLLCYGPGALASARFPFLFLLLMIPIPPAALGKVISVLQWGSAELAYAWFQLSGEAVFREGYVFSLPGLSIEIASQCSSIRSSQTLIISGILAGHVFLQSGWRKVLLSALTVPVAMFTNSVRIVTLSLLAIRVDPGFLYGDLHHRGGALFALIALSIVLGALLLLYRSEAR